MVYWSVGMLVIVLIVGAIILLISNIQVFAIIFISLNVVIGAYPLGKKVVEIYNNSKK